MRRVLASDCLVLSRPAGVGVSARRPAASRFLGALIVLAPMYGGGALLIREVVRRTGYGWASIITLGLVFAIFEEAFHDSDAVQSQLSRAEPSSLAACIYSSARHGRMVDDLRAHPPHRLEHLHVNRPDRSAVPGPRDHTLAASYRTHHHGPALRFRRSGHDQNHAKGRPLCCSPSSIRKRCAGLCSLDSIGFSPAESESLLGPAPGNAPSSWIVGAAALAAGSAFMLVPPAWGWIAVAAYLGLDLVMIIAVSVWSHRSGWGSRHRLALAAGAALTYAWHSFPQKPVVPVSARLDLVGDIVFSLGAVFVIWMAAHRQRTSALDSDDLS